MSVQEKEGEFKKRLNLEDVDLTPLVPKELISLVIEEAKKELFASMPKQTEPNITEDLDQDDTPLIVKISLDDWNLICKHWKTLKKWFGEETQRANLILPLQAKEFKEKVGLLIKEADKLQLLIELDSGYQWESGIDEKTRQTIKEPRFVQSAKIYSKPNYDGLLKIRGFDDIAKMYEPMLDFTKKVLTTLYKEMLKKCQKQDH